MAVFTAAICITVACGPAGLVLSDGWLQAAMPPRGFSGVGHKAGAERQLGPSRLC
ncbi:MAG: hypothetical protein ACLT98_02015 [Eggerthellaceae bacterium]